MNYQEFIDTYNGKSIDYDGVSGVQCVDLAKLYMNRVFGLNPGAWGNAKDYFENYNNLPLNNTFDIIANSSDFVPLKGDIVIWGTGLGNKYGHIAVATGEGNTSNFYSYDLNWGSKNVHRVLHDYKGFLGVLRAKDQTKITGVIIMSDLQSRVHIEDIGWTDWKDAGEVLGTTGQAKRIEAIQLQGNNGLDITYRVHMSGIGWSDWTVNGQAIGTTGESRRIEAIEITSNRMLEVSEHVQGIGWMPASTGKNVRIGTEGKSLRLEAFKIDVK